jgi:exopolysaccharide production protein ExoQ
MSQLALVLTFAFILFLFQRESRQRTKLSGALWIPVIWFLMSGSKSVEEWFSPNGTVVADPGEASPIDAAIFFSLIAAAFYVLKRRHVTLAKFVHSNRWLTIFLLYCLVAIVWSEFPFIAFKRWIKVLGNVLMVLIVLTDPDPREALRGLLKRSAYVFVPLSLLLIIFYPEYGQTFDPTSGSSPIGVTDNKNTLGHVCMILGLFLFWNTLLAFHRENPRARRGELFWSAVFLGMTCWLLLIARSSTSLACTIVGVLTIVLLRLRLVNKRAIGMYVLIGILALVAGEMVFGIYRNMVQLLGRNLTLTDRTELWPVLLKLQPNPILGAGFESFWLGARVEELFARYVWHPTEAHNGYLEIYLNLGIVGIVLFAVLIIETFWKIRLELLKRFELGRFRLACLAAILVYNYTEAGLRAVHSVYIIFFLIAVDYPVVRQLRPKRISESVRGKGEETVALPKFRLINLEGTASSKK